jgi:hypothetical protein
MLKNEKAMILKVIAFLDSYRKWICILLLMHRRDLMVREVADK